MPYPNEHSLRLQPPNKFDEFRRTNGGKLFNRIEVPKTISIIWGHVRGAAKGVFVPQALRFPTKDWTKAEAKKWIKDNELEGSFEPASKKEETMEEEVFRSLYQKLTQALSSKYPGFWVTEFSETTCLLRHQDVNEELYWLLNYHLNDNGEVEFVGEPRRVRQVVIYEPVVEAKR